MASVPSELILGLLTITLSAKGAPALWLVIPISILLIAFAWRVVRPKSRR